MAIFEIPRRLWRTKNVQFYPRPLSLSSASPFTGVRSVYGPIASAWVCKLTTVDLKESDWRALEALFVAAQGQAGLLRIGPPLKSVPHYNRLHGTGSGDGADDASWFGSGLIPALATVAAAAADEATSLTITGLPPSLDPALFASDVFEVRPDGEAASHGHMYYITGDAPSDSDGNATVSIVPPLRKAVAAGDQVVLRQPSTVMRPADDEQGLFTLSTPATRLGAIGFTLIEETEAQP